MLSMNSWANRYRTRMNEPPQRKEPQIMTDTANAIFLLTEDERRVLIPFRDGINQILAGNTPPEQQDEEFRRYCSERNLDIEHAKKLSKRIATKNWFSVFPTSPLPNGDWTGRDKTRPFMAFSCYSSDEPDTGSPKELLPIENYAAFYAVIQDGFDKSISVDETQYFIRQRAALGYDDSYLFVDDDSAMVLLSIIDVFKPIKRAGRLAATQGAITSIGGRLTFPSAKGFEKSFTPDTIKNIKPLPGREKEFKIDENTGEIIVTDAAKFEEVATLDGAFLGAIMSCALETDGLSQSIKVSVPRLCNELKIDPRKFSTLREKNEERNLPQLRYETLYREHISPFENFGGFINGTWYRIMSLSSYDEENEVITIHAPYIFRLLEILSEHQQQTHRSALNRLLKASVANEPNKAAVEIANLIIVKVLQLNDAGRRKKHETERQTPIEYRTLYSSLIADCPQLRHELAEIESSTAPNKAQRYNSKLKQTFETAFRIIFNKSSLPQKFLNLRINGIGEWESTYPPRKKGERRKAADFKIPTQSRIGTTKLVITHNGPNPNFKTDTPD